MATITKTIKASGGDYTTLSAFIAGEATDLVADGDNYVVLCDAFVCNDSAMSFSAWTTGAGNGIEIKAAAGHEHGGVAGAGFVLRGAASSYSYFLSVNMSYITLADIEVENTSALSSARAVGCGVTGFVATNVIVSGGSGVACNGFHGFADHGGEFINCLAYNCSGDGFYSNNYDSPIYRNCTSVKNANGFNRAGTGGTSAIAENCVAHGNSSADFAGTKWNSSSSRTNASGDTTAVGVSPTTGIVDADFEDWGGDDFAPASGGALIDVGTTLAQVLTDIAGAAHGASWDIGAYELVSGGSTVISADAQFLFGLAELIGSDNQQRWNAREFVSADDRLPWNLTELVSADRQVLWSLGDLVATNLHALYEIHETVTRDGRLPWNISALIASDAQLLHSIHALVSQSNQAPWNVAGLISRDSELPYAIQEIVTASSQILWDILEAGLVGAELQALYSIAQTVRADSGIPWDISGLTQSDAGLLFNIAQLTASGSQLPWTVLQAVANDAQLLYNLQLLAGLVSADMSVRWTVNQLTSADSSIRWSILGDVIARLLRKDSGNKLIQLMQENRTVYLPQENTLIHIDNDTTFHQESI